MITNTFMIPSKNTKSNMRFEPFKIAYWIKVKEGLKYRRMSVIEYSAQGFIQLEIANALP